MMYNKMARYGFRCAITFMLAMTAASSAPAADDKKIGALAGEISVRKGEPLAGGMIFFFNTQTGPPPSATLYWRVPDESSELDKDGKFRVELPEGRYYLGAMKKFSNERIGPPREGDLFFMSADEHGVPKVHEVKKGELTDIGAQSGAGPFSAKPVKQGVTAVEGVVLTPEGKPVEGAMVFAYVSPGLIGRPLYVSDKTGKDGAFVLRAAEGGNYYLKVRDVYGGGPPEKGAVLGGYGDDKPAAVAVRSGETVKGIQIRVVRFPGRGRQQE